MKTLSQVGRPKHFTPLGKSGYAPQIVDGTTTRDFNYILPQIPGEQLHFIIELMVFQHSQLLVSERTQLQNDDL